jgi:hypothetical protein
MEELRQECQQNLEVTQDFLTLRHGELEFWKTKDKSKRRIDLVRVRDEVAHGGQVVADLLMIAQVMS